MANKATLPLSDAPEWTHFDLSATLLELAVAQIKHAMADNDESMMALAEAHQAIGVKLQAIATALTAVDSSAIVDDENQPTINQNLGQMIMAFQGHDALNQRLDHVCEMLEGVKNHMSEESLRHNEQAWTKMVNKTEQRYTMKEERHIFRKIVKRTEAPDPVDDGADIELF